MGWVSDTVFATRPTGNIERTLIPGSLSSERGCTCRRVTGRFCWRTCGCVHARIVLYFIFFVFFLAFHFPFFLAFFPSFVFCTLLLSRPSLFSVVVTPVTFTLPFPALFIFPAVLSPFLPFGVLYGLFFLHLFWSR